jgi:alpha-glucosidase
MNPPLKIYIFIILIMAGTTVKSQGRLNENIGNFKTYKNIPNGIEIEADRANIRITVYADDVIRVRATQGSFSSDFSYAVIQNPLGEFSSVNDAVNKIILTTKSLVVEITKQPLLVRFLTLQGKVINEDEQGMGMSWIGTETSCYKKLQSGEKFIGLGEKTGNFNRRGSAYENWNNDHYGYPTNADPLYTSLPFYIGIHNQLVYGIFFDNTFRATFNFGASNHRFSSFSATDGEMNYYFFGGQSVAKLIEDYTALTGRIKMPPLWSLGFQQSRWSYFPDTEVLSLGKMFREKHIPIDVIYLDIHYMDAYKIFTWDSIRFPKPQKMIAQLKEIGIQTAVIVDPGIKIEKGYKQFEEGVKNNYFVQYPDGELFSADVWPGTCHFPDFTNDTVRKWWGNSFKKLTDHGVSGFWNDMNEPAAWGNHVPECIEFELEGRKSTLKEAHNIYGLQMSRSTYEGVRELMDGKRPFVLTRAAYSGIQRYSAVWTGDNVASDEHMMLACNMINSLGISGVPFVGADIGGFSGNPTKELFARWLSIGVFTPFCRNHSEYNSPAHEPWSFGESVEDIAREYITERYKLLPYIYSVFYETHQTGIPVARSLTIDNTFDDKVYQPEYQYQFLFGPSLLIAPVSSKSEFCKLYLPEGGWYKKGTDKFYSGQQEIIVEAPLSDLPVFVKAGAILPMQDAIQSTAEKPGETLQIHVYKGNSKNQFMYYEDDGESYAYEKGGFFKKNFIYDPLKKMIAIGKTEGSYISTFKKYKIIFHGFGKLAKIYLNGAEIKQDQATESTSSVVFNTQEAAITLNW